MEQDLAAKVSQAANDNDHDDEPYEETLQIKGSLLNQSWSTDIITWESSSPLAISNGT